jgi:hypothetical protein
LLSDSAKVKKDQGSPPTNGGKLMKIKPLGVAMVFGLFVLFNLALSNPIMAGSTSISAAGDNSFVLKPDGTLWAWGANNKGSWAMAQQLTNCPLCR